MKSVEQLSRPEWQRRALLRSERGRAARRTRCALSHAGSVQWPAAAAAAAAAAVAAAAAAAAHFPLLLIKLAHFALLFSALSGLWIGFSNEHSSTVPPLVNSQA